MNSGALHGWTVSLSSPCAISSLRPHRTFSSSYNPTPVTISSVPRLTEVTMHLPFLAILLEFSRTAVSMSAAGIVLFVIGAFAATRAVAESRGIEKVVSLSNLLFAMPLAVFGAEHFATVNGIAQMVPSFVPWHLFWAYFVGVALVAASLSIATKIQVQWSGLLFGIMMFLFVAMMDLPGAIQAPHNRIIWTLLFRELSFGCGGFCLAALAMDGGRAQGKSLSLIHI